MGINEIREEIISRKLLFLSEELYGVNQPLQYLLLALAKNNPFLTMASEYARNFDEKRFSRAVQNEIIEKINGDENQKISYIENNFEEIRKKCVDLIREEMTVEGK